MITNRGKRVASINVKGRRMPPIVVDKRKKLNDLLAEAVGDQLKSAVGSIAEEVRGQLGAFEGKIDAKFTEYRTETDKRIEALAEALPPSRKIRFDPTEAKAPFTTSGKLGDKGGYSFRRVIQAQLFKNWRLAKNEYGVHEMLWGAGLSQLEGEDAVDPGAWITPLCPDYLPEKFSGDIKALLHEGAPEVGLKDLQRVFQKVLGVTNDQLGGYLQEPVLAPEVIDLLRAQVVVQQAGAIEIPLPPSGQLDWPKLTGDVAATWVGEGTNLSTTITTNATFGALLLRAKKLASFQAISRELILFSAPAVETIIRQSMAKQIAIKEDQTWLQGSGTQTTPMGILNTPGVTTFTASTTGGNGDTFNPQDVSLMVAQCGEQNGRFESWIMRPLMAGVIFTRRADGGSSANKGPFMFDAIRALGDKYSGQLAGYPILTSTSVSGTRIKGTGTTLSYILGGMFSQCVIGRAGTLEIRASDTAGTSFETDQVYIRGISRADFGIKVPGAIIFCDNLLQS